MFARTVRIHNRAGLHARPATLFAETASRFSSAIRATVGDLEADARSILGLMLLEAVSGVEITIEAKGEDEIAAVNSLADLVVRGFDEEKPHE